MVTNQKWKTFVVPLTNFDRQYCPLTNLEGEVSFTDSVKLNFLFKKKLSSIYNLTHINKSQKLHILFIYFEHSTKQT